MSKPGMIISHVNGSRDLLHVFDEYEDALAWLTPEREAAAALLGATLKAEEFDGASVERARASWGEAEHAQEAIARFIQSKTRLARLEELDAPATLIGNEDRLLAKYKARVMEYLSD